jgi:hypothetical protein
MLEQMGPAQVKILAKLAFGKAAVLNAVTCDGPVFNFAEHIRDALPKHFPELAVFDARLYIRVRRIDEPA